ncbi:LOB domain-containing protein 7-like [Zingiber officinale]|uniref:LOB domain-containing protein 7-like n=1 Tax=Zingiber officinale TaxID=94328 RepID=UPI001C4CC0B2|nr:LOB domain-containing protein 7-like [Zingiber officinale]
MSPSISTSNTSSTKSSSTTIPTINPSASSSSSSSGQSGTANSACAACRHQRRRCKPDCTLAPYFPANDQHKFLNAHRLFGVSNIIKIIANLDPLQRNEAMRTIIFQSDMRAQDPVGGCYQLIQDLDNQIKHHVAELQLVHRHLSICRAQAAAAAAAAAAQASDLDVVGPGSLLPVSGAAQDVVLDPDTAVNIYEANLYSASMNNNLSQQQHEQQQFYNNNYFCFDNINGNNHNNGNCIDVHSDACDHNLLSTLQQQQQHHQCVVGDDEEVKPLVDMFEVRTLISADDDRDSSGNNVASTSSDQVNGSDLHGLSLELKEEVLNQVAQEHDLKGAASLFTLTNFSSSVL